MLDPFVDGRGNMGSGDGGPTLGCAPDEQTSLPRRRVPQGDLVAFPKGDQADATRFKSAVTRHPETDMFVDPPHRCDTI